jgi:antitoxin component YwqK of YwqJK toxin-antitoxin module
MKTKQLTFLLSLTFMFLVGCGEEVQREFNDNGKILVIDEEEFKPVWYESGKKRSESYYTNGGEDGLITQTFWYETGEKSDELNFKDNQIDGLQTSWYKNGNKQTELQWKMGRVWLVTNWDEDGNMTNQYDNKGRIGE